MKKIGKAVVNYLIFFLMAAFIVTCCVSLFTEALTNNLGIVPTKENLDIAAKMTFVNVIVLSLIFTMIDALRRKLMVQKCVEHIVNAAKELVAGDFSVQVKPINRFGTDESFNEIIECFNKMAQELSGVEALRTDFISNVSHEMKTPLAVMQNYGTLLQTPELPDEKRMEYAKGITESSRRLADMMTNILKLNKLENQQIYPNIKEYNLGEQLCEVLLQFENTWERDEIEIETDIAEDVNIYADRELLELVWNNLLSNAFKFTPQGGMVSVTLEMEERHVIVKVKDTGCGMSADTGAHIFEKFYQGDTSRSTQGNGLGLALVKRVVDIMHGEIYVESVIGKGSVFTVILEKKMNDAQ